MAVLALGFVGEAIGAQIGGTLLGITAASLGGFVGSAIGSMVDNMLFPVKQQGPRLSDLTVQTSTYGNAIPFIVGPENRIAGNVIWSSGLLETEHHEHSGKGGPSVDSTTWTYRASFAVGLGDCSKRGSFQAIEKIWANKKLIYDATGSTTPDNAGLWSSMTFYEGSFTQSPDPTMESYLGVGEVPGYRGTSYCVLADFQLADYGNRVPSLEFLIRADDEATIGGVLRQIVTICGFDPNTVSTCLITGELRGFVIGTPSSGTAAIQPLALVGNFDSAQVAGALRFQPRGNAPFSTVDLDYLGGHATGEDRPSPLQWTRTPETGLPREASISYPDPDRDHQINSQTARRQTGSSQNNLSSQLPVVVDATTARALADRMLWEAWIARATAASQTDDRLIYLEAGRTYCFQTPGGVEPLRLKSKTRGANGVIELELARDQDAVFRSTAPGVASVVPTQVVNVPGATQLFLLDIPILRDADDDAGFYYVVTSATSGWRGGDVLRALTISSDYAEVSPVGVRSKVGDVTGTVPDGETPGDNESASAFAFDDVTVIRVTLDDPTQTLESIDDETLFAGGNGCFIGDAADTTEGEILQYGIATLVSAGVYDLSHLFRGRQGTEFATGLHGSGEIFVQLETLALYRKNYGIDDLNLDRAYKGVSLLTAEADAPAVHFTNTGVGLRPWSPVTLDLGGVTGGDLTLSWTRRSRLASGALGEASERYTVRIMNSLGTVILREVTVTTPSYVYRQPDQVADFGGPIATLRYRVAQVSEVYGNGIFAEFNDAITVGSSGDDTAPDGTLTEVSL